MLAKAELRKVLERNEGNLVHSAHDLGMSRRQLYRLVYRAELWPVVNMMRSKRAQRRRDGPEWLARTRQALGRL